MVWLAFRQEENEIKEIESQYQFDAVINQREGETVGWHMAAAVLADMHGNCGSGRDSFCRWVGWLIAVQVLNVPQGRRAKLAPVFAAKLRGAFVAYPEGSAGGIQMLHKHEPAGLVQAHPFLALQGAHACHGSKVVVKGRRAHAYLSRKAVYLKGLNEVIFEPVNGLGNLKAMAARRYKLPQVMPLFAHQ